MKRYIKSNEVSTYKVYYIDRSSDRECSRIVEADSEDDAKKIAKKELGSRMYRLIRIEPWR